MAKLSRLDPSLSGRNSALVLFDALNGYLHPADAAKRAFLAERDLDYGIVVVRDACYSTRGPNNDFFMDRVFPRMARVMTAEEAVSLMIR